VHDPASWLRRNGTDLLAFAVIQTLGGRAEFQQLNVTSESEFEAAIAKSVSFGGGRLDM
jgi:hypothetical protein